MPWILKILHHSSDKIHTHCHTRVCLCTTALPFGRQYTRKRVMLVSHGFDERDSNGPVHSPERSPVPGDSENKQWPNLPCPALPCPGLAWPGLPLPRGLSCVVSLTQGTAQLCCIHPHLGLLKLAVQSPVGVQVPSAAVVTHCEQQRCGVVLISEW